jgi:hypothetical protein
MALWERLLLLWEEVEMGVGVGVELDGDDANAEAEDTDGAEYEEQRELREVDG